MKMMKNGVACVILAAGLLVIAGCAESRPQPNSSLASPTPNVASQRSLSYGKAKISGRKDSITASPNPIPVCDSSGKGKTTLSWTAQAPGSVEVHVSAPDGPHFIYTGPEGHSTSGQWVTHGMVFYL